jgi:dienelactone hydrolase
MKRTLFTVIFLLLWNSSLYAYETIKIPTVDKGLFTDSVVYLEATVHRPEGTGPFPLVVLNHGTSIGVDGRKTTYVWKKQSKFFVDRGYVVVIPMRKGYGKSEGRIITDTSCKDADWYHIIEEDSLDVEKTIEFMKLQPYIRKDKIVVMGQSTGGAVSIAIGSKNIPGVVGVINFAGGRGFSAQRTLCNQDSLIAAMGYFGEKFTVPSLWIYAENDKYFPPAISKQMYARFSEHGKNSKYILKPSFGNDGHAFFHKGEPAQWEKEVDEFLSQLN